ncbi:MAG TPA: hypothetical protein VN903_18300, partial [Polyangia bacterium]|nr:hypothetical protein [Polyangia bacterium]
MRRAVVVGAAICAIAAAAAGCRGGREGAGAVSLRRAPLTWGPTPNGVDTPVVGVSPRATVPRGTFNGREMIVTWEDFRGVAATRVSEDGKVFDDANFHING